MNWAPCLAASCARSSCFWIIDSLSPVQLAWTSAPRTVRDIGSPSSGWEWVRGGEGTPRSAGSSRVATRRTSVRGSAPVGASAGGGRLVRLGLGPAAHVVLGELAAAALGVEPADEDVRELPVDLAPVIGQVAGAPVGHEHIAVDREDVVVGLPRAGRIRIVTPRGHHGRPADEGLVEGVVRVADIGAEEVADGDRIVQSPGVDVTLEPVAEAGAVHGCLPLGLVGKR